MVQDIGPVAAERRRAGHAEERGGADGVTRAHPEAGEGGDGTQEGRPRTDGMSLYACLFLVFLLFPLVEAWGRGGWHRPVGVAVVVAFCLWYGAGYYSERFGWRAGHGRRQPAIATWITGLVVLTVLLVVVTGSFGAAGMTYVACGGAALTPTRPGLAIVAGSGLVTALLVAAAGQDLLVAGSVAGWVLLIGLMVWGSVAAGRQREVVLAAREERAELAVELERTRLARDLHDILGHSLTVITVKAELAGRLVDLDPERAKAEIADLERLSRDALADVRTTVSDYRTLSLPVELTRAAHALAAAGIAADVPSAADAVPTGLRDPFAWVVREGVTNVIRHSGAATCTITLTPSSVEVRDDGRLTGAVAPGNGLTGLRERARQAGLRIVAEPARPHGFVLSAQEDS
ncbi:sensor histidine kinase [Agilicoccus flavus]|uniref:sensor histidine kinase n=1 Tax=Agilicoccus flavus TaxID=2775968 RepID=UPI001CF6BE7B|nr:sensor histidine kinase [Agilicoccus flavus]